MKGLLVALGGLAALLLLLFVVPPALDRLALAREHRRIAAPTPEQKVAELGVKQRHLDQLKAELFSRSCRNWIESGLHDPSSAQWVDTPAASKDSKDGTFTALVTLRAKNGFGALRLARYECHGLVVGAEALALSVKEAP